MKKVVSRFFTVCYQSSPNIAYRKKVTAVLLVTAMITIPLMTLLLLNN